ncbi:hypothetical protein MYCTH_86821 [Thermothelomyces thermophilus ATCC 42464]|uniref:Uncharacterized protein n=1 Tax=Thermothelomyces thermophilus (strain ATCC 42464 / BCRC 31852 / DSM 1799) TaxID=573729 RepID=G2PZU6_THET4|nr:uncharacterized protein MYCTH_86821 [Thermothelomyces thermophilus ATCC 42464]AEO53969.1 hypothetical protein MYCTH_86821 [Thermothelomyces thermophilus ATCC 42464]
MATSLPLPFKAPTPVTPPPELQMFSRGASSPSLLSFNPAVHRHPTTPPIPNSTLAREGPPLPREASQPSLNPPASNPAAFPTTAATRPPNPENIGNGNGNGNVSSSSNNTTKHSQDQHQYHYHYQQYHGANPRPQQGPLPFPPSSDPHYLAMAARIASYYQQRCREWASEQERRRQTSMQAATLVVAWYMRDRVLRRRRRRRRAFRRALRARSVAAGGPAGRAARGERLRRWLLGLPPPPTAPLTGSPAGSAAAAGGLVGDQQRRTPPADRDEAEFDIDRDVPTDGDAQLLETTKNIINSQLARLDVPLLGTVSFDDSESETEDEAFMDYEDHECEDGDDEVQNEEAVEEEEEEEEDDDEEYTEYDEDDDEGVKDERGEDGEGNDADKEEVGKVEVQRGGGGVKRKDLASASKDVQLGTTAIGSRKRPHSMIS